jgi:hypothetical protein
MLIIIDALNDIVIWGYVESKFYHTLSKHSGKSNDSIV